VVHVFAVGKVFESANLLIQTNGRDPLTIESIAVLLAIVSLAASVWPVRGPRQLDLLAALRRE
jgi:hypothetical protein